LHAALFVGTSLGQSGKTTAMFHQNSRSASKSDQEKRRQIMLAILERYRELSKFPGAVASAYFPDGTPMTVAVGYADRDTKRPMRSTDLLHAGSVGKTFFAALALQLVAEGKIGLDDRVEKYLGSESWFARLPNHEAITVRMLLNHTSGLPTYGNAFMQELVKSPSRVRTPMEALQSVLDGKPLHPAGTKFVYSDVNYLLLGVLIESVTHKKAFDEIERRLFKPLKLRHVYRADRLNIPRLVPGYAGKENPFGGDEIVKHGRFIFDTHFEWAAGGFVANAGDLARWVAAYCQGKAFDENVLPEFFKEVDAPELGAGAHYGLGIVIEDTPVGKAFGHGGFFPGYVTWVRWYPEKQIAIALQLNTSDDALIKRSLRDVMNEMVAGLAKE